MVDHAVKLEDIGALASSGDWGQTVCATGKTGAKGNKGQSCVILSYALLKIFSHIRFRGEQVLQQFRRGRHSRNMTCLPVAATNVEVDLRLASPMFFTSLLDCLANEIPRLALAALLVHTAAIVARVGCIVEFVNAT